MKNIQIFLFCFTIIGFLMSCSNSLDKPFKKLSLEDDLIEIKKTLSTEDLKLLTEHISLKIKENNNMLGLTYSDLLSEAKELKNKLEETESESDDLAKSIETKKVALKEKGNFVFDYDFNIALKKKKIAPYNISIIDDGKKIKISGKSNTWVYEIREEIESSESIYQVKLFGGNTALDGREEYELTINDGIAKMVRLSNKAKWWYVAENARLPFENKLEKAGLIFHK